MDSLNFERSNFPTSKHHSEGDQDGHKRDYGIDISYYRSWKEKEIVFGEIHGSLEEAYRLLLSYMVQLTRVVPGKQTCLVRESDGSFLRFFWAFRPCIHSYKSHMRKIICVDGTYLTSKYFGTLLAVCRCDAQNHIFPITFAIVESENKDSWTWFLTQMRDEIINMKTNIVIISDRWKGLMEVVFLDYQMPITVTVFLTWPRIFTGAREIIWHGNSLHHHWVQRPVKTRDNRRTPFTFTRGRLLKQQLSLFRFHF